MKLVSRIILAHNGPVIPDRRLADVHHAIVSCERCPRLRDYCRRVAREKKRAHRDDHYWGRPVPGFGDADARLLIVGLAPAAHGANRTGRVFTGDGVGGSGDFLMSALHRTGFASIATSQHVDDGLTLTDAYILAAVRCAPPDNKPRPEEIVRCLDHLDAELAQLPRVRVVVALGKIAFDAWLQQLKRRRAGLEGGAGLERSAELERSVGLQPRAGVAKQPRQHRQPKPRFGHGVVVRFDEEAPILVGCYHPSRQNTNTGVLTARMLEEVFRSARALL
jgi:uracil-DNA glycosylase family 4